MTLRNVIYRGQVCENYFLDKDGNFYSNKKGYLTELRVQNGDNWNPYPKVSMSFEGKSITVMLHRLVCETFHKKPMPKVLTVEEWNQIPKPIREKLVEHISHADRYQVNHIDHDINNYHPSNLEWVTTKENQQKYQEHRNKNKTS